jgi:hypothetical protein
VCGCGGGGGGGGRKVEKVEGEGGVEGNFEKLGMNSGEDGVHV